MAAVDDPGAVTVDEVFYGAKDGTCCPSGLASTTWTLASGRLRPGRPVIRRRPN